jgi:tetratricopeptide (TPR) repeat protein
MAEAMLHRISEPPFTAQLEHAERMRRAYEAVSVLDELDRTNYARSQMMYAEALKAWPDDWRLHNNFARVLHHHQDADDAVQQWQRVAQLLPHRVKTYSLLGKTFSDLGRLADAEASYREALSIEPDCGEAMIGLGYVRVKQGRKDEALHWFRRAVTAQSHSVTIQNDVGVALLDMGRSSDAEAMFRAALRIGPDYQLAQFNLAGALEAQGRNDEAIATYRALLEQNPGEIHARLALAKLLSSVGNAEEAIRQYREVVEQRPDDYNARCALGDELLQSRRLAEAAEAYGAAMRLQPADSLEPRMNYATILGLQGRSAEARNEFEEIVALEPQFVPAYVNLAITLMQLGETEEAVSQLRIAARKDPQNERVRDLLEELLAQQREAVEP